MKTRNKFYAVKVGRKTGIWKSWDEIKPLVLHYPGARYKGFVTEKEAKKWLEAKDLQAMELTPEMELPEVYAFVDGSYNKKTRYYGYGGFLVDHGEKFILQGADRHKSMTKMQSVSGEVCGAKAAMELAIERGISEMTLFYDNKGIECWATGEWHRTREGTKKYHRYYCGIKGRLKIHFVHVKAHTGIPGNEEADRLAREAVGLEPREEVRSVDKENASNTVETTQATKDNEVSGKALE